MIGGADGPGMKGRMSRAVIVARLLSLCLSSQGISQALAHPPWQNATPGTSGWLGDDGVSDRALLCDTLAEFRQAMTGATEPAGCRHLPRGPDIFIQKIGPDPMPAAGARPRPSVRVLVPSLHYAGWTRLIGQTHPRIPPGALVHSHLPGGMKMFPTPAIDVGREGITGGPTLAHVIRHVPEQDKLLVQTPDGRRGWVPTPAVDSNGADRIQVDVFYGAVLTAGAAVVNAR